MRWLDDLISASEEQIADRMNRCIASVGAEKHSPERDETLRKLLSSISSTLVAALRASHTEGAKSGLGLAREEYTFHPFCATEARARREREEDPAAFLKLVDLCRRSYLDMVEEALQSGFDKGQAALFLERFFARISLDFCREWCLLAEQEAVDLREREIQMMHRHGMEVLAGFAAGVAHEVRNSLHALMSVTEALSKELKDNSDAGTYLYHIRSQIDRLSLLMKDLLQVGKPVDPSRMRAEFLSEICLAAINTWKDSPGAKGHAVSLIQRPGDEGTMVLTDGLRLQQVFLNLLDNAGQHSPSGSEIEVVISDPSEKFAKVRVTDRGSGIPPEFRQKVFEPFFSTRRGGTGLGLTIVKSVLESQGGSIAIWNNDPPPGTTAEVSLPLAEGAEH